MPQTYPNLSVDELDADKLTPLLKLRYNNALNDAMADFGDAVQVRKAFAGFQRFYTKTAVHNLLHEFCYTQKKN